MLSVKLLELGMSFEAGALTLSTPATVTLTMLPVLLIFGYKLNLKLQAAALLNNGSDGLNEVACNGLA